MAIKEEKGEEEEARSRGACPEPCLKEWEGGDLIVSRSQSGRRVRRSALISPDLCLPVGNYTVPKAYPVRREQERNGGLDQLTEIGSVQRALRGKSTV